MVLFLHKHIKKGIAQTKVEKGGKTTKTGTIINFTPNYKVFVGQEYEHTIIDERLRELGIP